MSRSLGDFVGKKFGCSCLPEIFEYSIDDNSEFLIIASDGIWEFLDNNKVCNIIYPFYIKKDPNGACAKVIEEAAKMWKLVSIKKYYYNNRRMMVKMTLRVL